MSLQRRYPTLRVKKDDSVTVVKVAADDLCEANIQAVGEELFRVAELTARRRLQLDLGEVGFLTSTALGKFITLHKRMRAGGGQLVLANVTGPVWDLFAVTRLDQILDVRRAEPDDGASRPEI